jgi:hypothetical protein
MDFRAFSTLSSSSSHSAATTIYGESVATIASSLLADWHQQQQFRFLHNPTSGIARKSEKNGSSSNPAAAIAQSCSGLMMAILNSSKNQPTERAREVKQKEQCQGASERRNLKIKTDAGTASVNSNRRRGSRVFLFLVSTEVQQFRKHVDQQQQLHNCQCYETSHKRSHRHPSPFILTTTPTIPHCGVFLASFSRTGIPPTLSNPKAPPPSHAKTYQQHSRRSAAASLFLLIRNHHLHDKIPTTYEPPESSFLQLPPLPRGMLQHRREESPPLITLLLQQLGRVGAGEMMMGA